MSEIDVTIGRVVRRRHGIVARRQLVRLGLSGGAIAKRIADGRLVRLHRGVYAFGHTELRPEGHWLAAVLAYGDRAVLSHGTALAAWGLRDMPAVWVDVTVPTAAGVWQRKGTRLFRHAGLRDGEITVWRGIPITTVPRALLDGATILPAHVLMA